ncbi:MAG: hypothetical protein UIL37_05930 [Clostridia bacterium]|nr:hypothetical protein [Clostridia bacterium]
MLFFIVCACFALFPEKVLAGASEGLLLCINAIIPSLLPFMLISTCLIKSHFSRPMGRVLSKVITPITGISPCGCTCLVTGLIGGYGAGVNAVMQCRNEGQISQKEAEAILGVCNNAGPLFVIATVGIKFLSSEKSGIMLFAVQVLSALICGAIFSVSYKTEETKLKDEWIFYKKNKPPFGSLIAQSAAASGSAIISVCVFVISFSAVLEILNAGEYPIIAGVLEVMRGCSELAKGGRAALPLISAALSWGGLSVHLQANSICGGRLSMKKYYISKALSALISYCLTAFFFCDIYIILSTLVLVAAAGALVFIFKNLFGKELLRQHGFRQRRHS